MTHAPSDSNATGSTGSGAPTRAWQRMLSGRRLDLLNPSPVDVEIEDIAHGLSRVARWNGQTHGDWAFSVAQHCVLVEQIARRLKTNLKADWCLGVLLHDAPEYVVGDLITPFKAAVGLDYKTLERRLMNAVLIRFGLPGELPPSVTRLTKRADAVAAYLEATQLAGFDAYEAKRTFGRPRNVDTLAGDLQLTPWPPQDAKARFLARFAALAPAAAPAGMGGLAEAQRP
jgi:hypothetical protein